MNSVKIQLTKTRGYEEGFLLISAYNGLFISTVKHHGYFNEWSDFGKKLQRFPQSISDEVTLKRGEDDEKSHSYIFLRAYLYDSAGHAALEVRMRQNDLPVIAYGRFTILTEAASLNEFGRVLSEWANSGEFMLEHLLYADLPCGFEIKHRAGFA